MSFFQQNAPDQAALLGASSQLLGPNMQPCPYRMWAIWDIWGLALAFSPQQKPLRPCASSARLCIKTAASAASMHHHMHDIILSCHADIQRRPRRRRPAQLQRCRLQISLWKTCMGHSAVESEILSYLQRCSTAAHGFHRPTMEALWLVPGNACAWTWQSCSACTSMSQLASNASEEASARAARFSVETWTHRRPCVLAVCVTWWRRLYAIQA